MGVTREELREGIRTSILENTQVNIQRGVVWKVNGLSNFLSYLHSQGVVIKVDRELPYMFEPAKSFYEFNKDKDMTLAQWMTGYITCRDGVCQAGYVAVELLTKKGDYNEY